jgi:hypothetical protein
LLLWLIEPDVFQLPQLHKHFNVTCHSMKFPKFIIALLLLTACTDRKSTRSDTVSDGRTWNIKLANGLGDLNIILPKHLDTLISWTQYSDCGDPCAKVDYRIQPKSLPIFKESGFYYFPLADSVEQFTIKHSKIAEPWPIVDTSLVSQFAGKLKNEAFENHSGKFIIDTILKVDNRNVAVIAFHSFDTTKRAKVHILNALTSIDGNLIELFFESRKSYQDTASSNFVQTSFNALKTLRIRSGR